MEKKWQRRKKTQRHKKKKNKNLNNKKKTLKRIVKKNDKVKLFGRVFSSGCIHCIAMGDEWKNIIENQ